MLKRERESYQLTLLAGDLICLVAAMVLSVGVRTDNWRFALISNKSYMVATSVFIITLFYISDLYAVRSSPLDVRFAIWIAFDIVLGEFGAVVAFYVLHRWQPESRGIFLLTSGFATSMVLIWRVYRFHNLRVMRRRRRLLFLGSGPSEEELNRLAAGHNFDWVSVQNASPPHDIALSQTAVSPESPSYISNGSLFSNIDIVVLAPSFSPDAELTRKLIQARFSGLPVLDFAAFVQSMSSKLPVDQMDQNWFLSARGFKFFESGAALRAKRLLDLTLAFLFLIMSAPLFPLIALGIKLSSPGPAIFCQDRVGLGERVFRLIKFRTMAVDSESGGPVWASHHDPRIFPFGRFLRKLHLDELPQLVNIVKGEMSFVGPRPERPSFVEKLKDVVPFYDLRSSVRPGLSGWAQVNYPYGASVQDAIEKLKYDLFYIQNASLVLDLQIVLKTIGVSLGRRGSR